jgi:hypothetical protein
LKAVRKFHIGGFRFQLICKVGSIGVLECWSNGQRVGIFSNTPILQNSTTPSSKLAAAYGNPENDLYNLRWNNKILTPFAKLFSLFGVKLTGEIQNAV